MPALPLDITLSQFVRLERPTRPIAIGNIQQKPQTMRFVHGLRYIHLAHKRRSMEVGDSRSFAVGSFRPGVPRPSTPTCLADAAKRIERMGVSEAKPVIASHFSAWGKGQ